MSNFKTKTVRLPEDLIRRVDERAVRENRNFSNMVHTILKDSLTTMTRDRRI